MNALRVATEIAGGSIVAADSSNDTMDRVMGGVGAGSSALGAVGSWLAPGLSATATTGFGALGGTSVTALPGIVAETGAMMGTSAGIGAAAVPAAAVLSSAALGFGAGRLLDIGVGKASKAMGGTGADLSDRIAGVQDTVGTRGAGKTFGEMSQGELLAAAMFNEGMNPERRREILGDAAGTFSGLFGGMY